MLKALHGWYQWKAEIESNLEVPSIQSTFWVMWRKFNIKLSHSVFTWPLFVRKCLFFQTNQPFTQTCDICTHIVSYMVGKLLKRSTFLRTQLHSYDANLKSYEFIPHAGINYMWDLTPHPIGEWKSEYSEEVQQCPLHTISSSKENSNNCFNQKWVCFMRRKSMSINDLIDTIRIHLF